MIRPLQAQVYALSFPAFKEVGCIFKFDSGTFQCAMTCRCESICDVL